LLLLLLLQLQWWLPLQRCCFGLVSLLQCFGFGFAFAVAGRRL
jgi:hypothetical protein